MLLGCFVVASGWSAPAAPPGAGAPDAGPAAAAPGADSSGALLAAATEPESVFTARISTLDELNSQRRNAEAEKAARELLAALSAAPQPDSLRIARVLDFVVLSQVAAGPQRFAELRALSEAALRIKERTLGPDHPETARSLEVLGMVLAYADRHASAVPLLERSLAIRETALGPEDSLVARTLNNLANAVSYAGDPRRAVLLHERALAIRTKVYGPDHPEVARSLSNQANVVTLLGEHARARALYERALAIQERNLGPGASDVGATLNNLANAVWLAGDAPRAIELYRRSIAIGEKTLGPEHLELARRLFNLGRVLAYNQETKEARELLERALAIRERKLGPDHPQVAATLWRLAELARVTGDVASGITLAERALAIDEQRSGGGLRVALELGTLSQLEAGAHPARAESLRARALAIRLQSAGIGIAATVEDRLALAALALARGDTALALEHAAQGHAASCEYLRLVIPSLAEAQALKQAAKHRLGLSYLLMLAAAGRGEADNANVWDAVIRSRALVLDGMAARHRALRHSARPEIRRLATELGSVSTELANLVVRGEREGLAGRARASVDSLRSAQREVEAELAVLSPRFREEMAQASAGYSEVRSSLPDGSALVSYCVYQPIVRPSGPLSGPDSISAAAPPGAGVYWYGPAEYVALVLGADHLHPRVVALGPAARVDSLVEAWRSLATSPPPVTGDVAAGAAAVHRRGGALREQVWDPLVPLLAGARQVFLVPDGSLNLVNLAALPAEAGQFLVESGPSFQLLSAERDLASPQAPEMPGEGLLALGGVDFDTTDLFAALSPGGGQTASGSAAATDAAPYRSGRPSCGDFAALRFTPLPATRIEADEVARLWKSAGRSSSQALELVGSGATEETFKRAAPRAAMLHLATHAYFLSGDCHSPPTGADGLALPAGLADEPLTTLVGENPLLLSGLALAGANHREVAGAGEEDGVLTAEEIAALDLSGVRWAVLSACETGGGPVSASEGVLGLRRAFQVAGARTLIMSLWPVEDTATRQWMEALYEGRLLRRQSAAEAVRSASLEILRGRRSRGESTHPFYWGAFVGAGDWR